MSTENIRAFLQKAEQEPLLKERVEAIFAGSPETFAAQLAELAAESNFAFTADEFEVLAREKSMSDAELLGVAGGAPQSMSHAKKRDSNEPGVWDRIKGIFS